jgi:phenylacetic acid degradation operon negative regulatory protein
VSASTRALLRACRRDGSLRATSLLVTVFGDGIAPRGAQITLGSLIRLAAPFGLSERHVRTSVGRLAHDGWLACRRQGRRSSYRLSERGLERFADATARIYGPPASPAHAGWTLVLAPGARRSALHRELLWRGFGALPGGLFAHPGLDEAHAVAWLEQQARASGIIALRARAGHADSDARLAARGWDLAALAARYRRFLVRFAPAARALRGRGAVPPECAFVLRTLLIHEYRRVHLRDPLLPASLLPGNWAGIVAYALCRRLYGRVFAAAEQHLSTVGATLAGPLPPPRAAIYRRFGGLPRPRVS